MEHEFIHGNSTENGKIAWEQMEIGVETAAQMGIRRLMIPNFIHNLITCEEHIEHAREALSYACRLGAEQGITILTENALDWKRQIELLDAVGADNLKNFTLTPRILKFNFDMESAQPAGRTVSLYGHNSSCKRRDGRSGKSSVRRRKYRFLQPDEIFEGAGI